MNNYEKYKEQIEKIVRIGRCVAVEEKTRRVTSCNQISCSQCRFDSCSAGNCDSAAMEWADAEYIEPIEPEVDWSKVAVDTPILVRDSIESDWLKRYFAKYENGKVYVFIDGSTSWSCEGQYLSWKYAKLAEVDNGI